MENIMAIEGDFLTDYQEFVDEVSSDATKNNDDSFFDALDIVDEQGVEPSRLLTAGIGLSGEVGEFNDIVKKCVFQGKELDDDVVNHLRSELGDIMWYVAQGCIALDTSIEEIIDINTAKLKDRYPGGFDEFRSDNRDEDDI
tara:strand:- start:189 stop:614 length:426 start_codon:yes stop_codon:yes gene_type:complete